MRRLFRMARYRSLKKENDCMDPQRRGEVEEEIPDSISDIHSKLHAIFKGSSDFVLREVIHEDGGIKIIIAYLDGMVNKTILNQDIIQPLVDNKDRIMNSLSQGKGEAIKEIKYNILFDCEIEDTKDFRGALGDILSGDSILFIDGEGVAIKLCTKGWEQRGIEKPETEAVVRGPREGFTESLRTNTSMLRRKIKNAQLKFEQMKMGTESHTDICICYIQGLANEEILKDLRRRLEQIRMDIILESAYIEEFIQDNPYSIFPTVGRSERPDVIAAKLLEGRIAILCDGTPFVLTVPHLFIETLQSNEDYYTGPFFASMVRLIRVFALIITTIVPAFYVALLSFHLGSIPFELLLSIAASREGVPFTSFLEALLMITAFEVLREAGVRMPRAVGQAVSIVGALILGEAAVNAGIASNMLIIVIALTAITSFIVNKLVEPIPFIRIALLIGANILGIMGIVLVTLFITIHMCSLKSFGVPYMSPLAPMNTQDLKDSVIRFPLRSLMRRPSILMWGNKEKIMRNR